MITLFKSHGACCGKGRYARQERRKRAFPNHDNVRSLKRLFPETSLTDEDWWIYDVVLELGVKWTARRQRLCKRQLRFIGYSKHYYHRDDGPGCDSRMFGSVPLQLYSALVIESNGLSPCCLPWHRVFV